MTMLQGKPVRCF